MHRQALRDLLKNRTLLLLSFLTLSGLCLRFYGLDARNLWGDELISVFQAKIGLVKILNPFVFPVRDGAPPLFYALLDIWMTLFGTSDAAVRSLSVVFGVCAIPLIFLMIRKLTDEKTALAGSLILAISPFHILYSQEARNYALLGALAIASTYLLFSYLDSRDKRLLIAFTAVTVTGIFTHYNYAFLVLAQNIFILVKLTQDRTLFKPWLASQSFSVLAYLSLMPLFLRRGMVSVSAIKQYLAPYPVVVRYIYTFFVFASGESASPFRYVLAGTSLGVFGVLFVFGGYRLSRERKDSFTYALVLLLVAAVVAFNDIYIPKYIMVAFPVFVLLVAYGLTAIPKKLVALPVFVIIALSMLSVNNLYQSREFHSNARLAPYSRMADYISRNSSADELAVFGYFVSHYYRGPAKPVIADGYLRTGFRLDELKGMPPGSKAWVVIPYGGDGSTEAEGWLEEHTTRLSEKGFLRFSETLADAAPDNREEKDHFKFTVYHIRKR